MIKKFTKSAWKEMPVFRAPSPDSACVRQDEDGCLWEYQGHVKSVVAKRVYMEYCNHD